MKKSDVNKILQDIHQKDQALDVEVASILEQTRKDIMVDLASQPADWKKTFLGGLLLEVDNRIGKLKSTLIDLADKATAVGENLGWRLGTAPVVTAQIQVGVTTSVGIDPNMLKVLADYRASLITSVTNECRDRITEIIRRSMLSGKPLVEVEREIGSALPGKGLFKSITMRSQTIIRTEYRRVLEQAAQLGLEKSAEQVPGLLKKWVTTMRNSRPAHIAANGQTVPVAEPFIVMGERLLYPHDLVGSPENTINCRCLVVPVVPEAV